MASDYPVCGEEQFGSATELCDFLQQHDGSPLRVIGTGGRQQELPAPAKPVHLIRLDAMNKIARLEAADLTCSVEPGLSRADLDHALADKGLQLPCGGRGSLGGLFACGEPGPLAPGAQSPRSLLLGMDCILAEGLAFKSGARVVKNVAGYDLQKLFIGSRGQLFIATLLHLKLRPMPVHRASFRRQHLTAEQAVSLFALIRQRSPSALYLEKKAAEFIIEATQEGRTTAGFAELEKQGLEEHPNPSSSNFRLCTADQELLGGQLRPSMLAELIARLPESAEFRCNGSAQFAIRMNSVESDALLEEISSLGGHAEIRMARPERRGLGTPRDPGHEHMAKGLKQALDPRGILH